MSIYSDYKGGALAGEEFDELCKWENAKARYEEHKEALDEYLEEHLCDNDCEHCDWATCPMEGVSE